MNPRTMTATVAAPDRKPRDDEIDSCGLTHPGRVRSDNQDHFLVCALRKQLVVQHTSLAAANELLEGSERVALLMMVADGVGGGNKGEVASRSALVSSDTSTKTQALNRDYAKPVYGALAANRPFAAVIVGTKR